MLAPPRTHKSGLGGANGSVQELSSSHGGEHDFGETSAWTLPGALPAPHIRADVKRWQLAAEMQPRYRAGAFSATAISGRSTSVPARVACPSANTFIGPVFLRSVSIFSSSSLPPSTSFRAGLQDDSFALQLGTTCARFSPRRRRRSSRLRGREQET
jgi:hypothetical protein